MSDMALTERDLLKIQAAYPNKPDRAARRQDHRHGPL